MRPTDGEAPRDYVIRRLDDAGETLMALPGRGCFPTGYRSSMPDYLQLPGDREASRLNPLYSADQTRLRWPRPNGAAITRMDEVYMHWIPLLPAGTDLELKTRRLVLLRSLVWPMSEREDPHRWTWRQLADEFHIEHHTAKSRFERAIDLLTWRLTRLPEPCAETIRRIARHRELVGAA